MNKLICCIMGGLGNQMFIYASARAFSLKQKCKLYMDIQSYDSDKFGREYLLNNFLLYNKASVLSEHTFLSRIYRKVVLRNSEGFNSFFEALNSNCSNVYIQNYFQDYTVFNSIRELLKKELSLKKPPNKNWQNLRQNISQYESVAIHIRLGDYVNIGWCMDVEYYSTAIKTVKEYLKDSSKPVMFVVFSEDAHTSKKMLDSLGLDINCLYVTKDFNLTDIEEFNLMRECDNFIISNSTFSWWAAYLGEKQKSIVVSPVIRNWIEDCWDENYFPENWLKIQANIKNKIKRG